MPGRHFLLIRSTAVELWIDWLYKSKFRIVRNFSIILRSIFEDTRRPQPQAGMTLLATVQHRHGFLNPDVVAFTAMSITFQPGKGVRGFLRCLRRS